MEAQISVDRSFQRRRHPRFQVLMQGDTEKVSASDTATACRIINLSRYGMAVKISPGARFPEDSLIHLTMPDGRSAVCGFRILHRRIEEGHEISGGILSFPYEDGRRKLHTLLKSLPGGGTDCRRKHQRRLYVGACFHEQRVRERRRHFGIFEPSAAFSSRAKAWDEVSSLFRCAEGISPVRIVLDGKTLISFGSKDYLGLSHDPRVKEAVIRAIERYGTHTTGSRAVNGTNPIHLELQHELASMLNVEDTLVFPSGYLANYSILTSLLKSGDVVYVDERIHASMIDGCLASRATVARFRHNSPNDLERKIARTRAPRSLILIEGVYSTEGDLCPLPEFKALAMEQRIPLMLDDGHGFGILGGTGAGTPEHFGLNGQVEIYVGLFSKVFGSLGGFVASSRELTDYLLRTSRGIIFTTALPAAMAAGVLAGLRIVRYDGALRGKLWSNVAKMKIGLEALGLRPTGGESPILTMRVPHEHTAYGVAKRLERLNIHVNTFVRPAVKRGESVVRVTMSASHSDSDIEAALSAFADVKPLIEQDRC